MYQANVASQSRHPNKSSTTVGLHYTIGTEVGFPGPTCNILDCFRHPNGYLFSTRGVTSSSQSIIWWPDCQLRQRNLLSLTEMNEFVKHYGHWQTLWSNEGA